ncbi:hypothetical protein ACIOC1_34050 [Streptomyces sp. NPDC088197]|uniref:hypothetical protein n=1 Tax=unclassified Streptomyces TaxID=2593676 RepID=UPI0036F14307
MTGGRPGPSLGPIAGHVRGAHRAWLEPVRTQFAASGLAVGDVARQAGYAKSKVSELLRGEGLYPTWLLTSSVVTVLRMPRTPMMRLWQQAAVEAHKDLAWIENCVKQVMRIPGEDVAPVDQAGFIADSEPSYIRYGSVFLGTPMATLAVRETSNLLWLRWDEILGSPDLHRTAWQILRHRVMARTPHTDDRPVLKSAARYTRALREARAASDTAAQRRQLEESLALFEAISHLPDAQMDVIILLHACGIDVSTTADVLGVPPAIVRSDELHAKRALASMLALLAPSSPVTPGGPAGPAGLLGRTWPPPPPLFATQTPNHPEGTSL